MTNIFMLTQTGLKRITEFEKGCWVNIANPSTPELDDIHQKLNVPLNFLTDPLDIDEMARIEVEDEHILIVLRIPYYDKDDPDVPFITIPMGIIFTDHYVITICAKEIENFWDFFNGRPRTFYTESKNRFLLQIFFKSALTYLKYLKEIDKRTDVVERELHKSLKNEELIQLLNLEKSLVYFATSLRSNELVMERLDRIKALKMTEDDKDILEDVIIENKQAIEMANINSNILSGMMDAFASVISNNLNVVVKLLTSVTIILMIPTLIASIYGMNVKLPFQDSGHAFLITIIISTIFSSIGVLIFWRKKWF